jgi:hypothetical protein
VSEILIPVLAIVYATNIGARTVARLTLWRWPKRRRHSPSLRLTSLLIVSSNYSATFGSTCLCLAFVVDGGLAIIVG